MIPLWVINSNMQNKDIIEKLIDTNKYSVKKISLLPNNTTIKKCYIHNNSIFIPLNGTMKVLLDDDMILLNKCVSHLIKKETYFSLLNNNNFLLEVLEVSYRD